MITKLGGARPGAGRKKGFKFQSTLDKAAAREAVRKLITRKLGPMVRAQVAHASGINHFFLRDPKTGQFIRITDPAAIEAALNSGDEGSHYWIFTKDPSVQAFGMLLDRALDKPKDQEIEIRVSGEVELVHRLASARGRVKSQPAVDAVSVRALPAPGPETLQDATSTAADTEPA